MQSRIYLGGFMKSIKFFQILFFIGLDFKTKTPVFLQYESIKPIETKTGAIPANFFFSL
jgi:hypothetical protein